MIHFMFCKMNIKFDTVCTPNEGDTQSMLHNCLLVKMNLLITEKKKLNIIVAIKMTLSD